MDPDPDPGGPKTCGSGSGSPTLLCDNYEIITINLPMARDVMILIWENPF
jgi:hypothetical protein